MTNVRLIKSPPPLRHVDDLARRLTEMPRSRAILANVAIIVALILVDSLSPPQFTWAPLYFLAVCLAAWMLGRPGGYSAAVACAVVEFFLQLPEGETTSALVFNLVTRLVSNMLIAAVISAMRRTYDREWALARTDGLTGALNRRAFHEAISSMLTRARRKHDVIVISYIDLDGFKQVNDTYGHAAGDVVLGAFADAARAEAGKHGALARVGGDEFVIIQICQVADDPFTEAEARHDRLTGALGALPYGVTCSMGVVIAQSGQTDEAKLVAFADTLLYEVKRAGKNALRIAEADHGLEEQLAA